MSNIIETSFFYLVRKLGFLFALMSLVLMAFLGLFTYEKISDQVADKTIVPIIELAKYQNPISLNIKQKKTDETPEKPQLEDQIKFGKVFDTQVNLIISNLESLPESVIGQIDLQSDVKTMIETKADVYAQELKLSYVKSLVTLTRQLINVGGNQVNINDFLQWYDQEFAQQVKAQAQQNLLKISTEQVDQMAIFISIGMVVATLGFFIMFVMMLAMLRIEKNTRIRNN